MKDDLKAYFDLVFPQKELSPWERLILLSSFMANEGRCGEKFTAKLGKLAKLTGSSETSVRQYIRTLNDKGVIQIDGFDRSGYQLTLVPPLSIPGVAVVPPTLKKDIDLDSLDFYEGRRFVSALLARQGGTCFYSLRQIDDNSCELDHLVPQANGLNNSFRNIVCSTFEMNKRKGSLPADDFLREQYRSGFLSLNELEGQLEMLTQIQSGTLKPDVYDI
jgi:biotin operon repressor